MKVSLSFKEDEKEMYNYLQSQLSASIYIKQLIKNDMEKSTKPEREIKTTKRNLLDF